MTKITAGKFCLKNQWIKQNEYIEFSIYSLRFCLFLFFGLHFASVDKNLLAGFNLSDEGSSGLFILQRGNESGSRGNDLAKLIGALAGVAAIEITSEIVILIHHDGILQYVKKCVRKFVLNNNSRITDNMQVQDEN